MRLACVVPWILAAALCASGQTVAPRVVDPRSAEVAEAWTHAAGDAERQALLRRYSPADRSLLRGICDEGEALQKAGQFPAAGARFDACRDLAQRMNDSLYRSIAPQLQGGLARMEGRYEESEKLYLEALESARAGAPERIPVVTNNLAAVYVMQARYPEGLDLLRKTIEDNESRGIFNDAAPYQNTGNIYGLTGDMNRALTYFLKAQSIYENRKDERKLALVHYNIGVAYAKQSNFAAAGREFEISEQLATKTGDRTQLSMTYSDLGRMRGIEGKTAEARLALRKAVDLAREIGFKSALADALLNIANFELDQAEYDRAQEHFTESLGIATELKDPYNQGLSIRGLGLLARQRKDYQQVLTRAQEGLELAQRTGDTMARWQAEALAGMAWRGLNNAPQARESYRRAIATIEKQRGMVAGGEVEKQRFFEYAVYPYQELALLEASSGNALAALQSAERARARVLLEIVEAGPASVDRLMTSQEQAQEKALRVRVASANARLSAGKPGAARDRDNTWHDYETFLAALYARRPELRTWRGESAPLSEADLETLVPDATSVLVEFLSGQDQTLVITAARAAGRIRLRTFVVPVGRDRLAHKAGAFRAQLENRDPGFRAPARELFDLLIAPAALELRDRNRVTLVADGPLWELPFQALLTPQGRYWIEDATISTAPSLSFLRDQIQLTRKRTFATELLALGDPTLSEQIRAVSALYPAGRVVVRTGADAKESAFKAEAPAARVLHIAAHGVMDRQNALHSRLLLSPEPGREDGWLEAWELMRMNLSADLAILSACESGRGRPAEGEGLVGLTWTLFVSGVRTAIVSQWRVDSGSTTELMAGLHQRLRRGDKPAEALRGAILSLMKDERYRHPMYWSAFVAAGV